MPCRERPAAPCSQGRLSEVLQLRLRGALQAQPPFSTHSPFFLSSGLPFLTVAMTMSPTPAAGSLFRRPLMPFTEMMYRFLAPVERKAQHQPVYTAPPPLQDPIKTPTGAHSTGCTKAVPLHGPPATT